MLTKAQLGEFRKKVRDYFEKAGIVLTSKEEKAIEGADFGLSRPEVFGLELVVYVNTARCCAKELVLFPGQICPEHRHPPVNSEPGKEERSQAHTGCLREYVRIIPRHLK